MNKGLIKEIAIYLSCKKEVLYYNTSNNTPQASLQCSPRGVSFEY